MNNWIIWIPIVLSVIGTGIAIWNARTTVDKTTFDKKNQEKNEKQSEIDKYIDALKGQLDIHEKEISVLKSNGDDINKRMLACELAREELVKRNVELEREKMALLTQLVAVGVAAQVKK